MNETNDPLKAELASFRPRRAVAALQRRIATRLASPPHPGHPGGSAGLHSPAAWPPLAWPRSSSGPPAARMSHTRRALVGPRPASRDPVGRDATVPTLQAYRQALAPSPQELDALLDKHAARAGVQTLSLCGTLAFTCSDWHLRAFQRTLMRPWNLAAVLAAVGTAGGFPRGGGSPRHRRVRPRGQCGLEVLAGLRSVADTG